jgi:quercetin dioxygenase-like cupin family protein
MKQINLVQPDVDNLEALGSQITWKKEAGSAAGTVLILPKTDGPPIHFHPIQREEFQVLQGELQVYKENKWITLKAGEGILIPARTAHTYKNTSNETAVFDFCITPKGRFKSMIEEMDASVQQGKITGKNLTSMMRLSKIMAAYPDVTQNVAPPQFVIKAMGKLASVFLK